VSTRRAEPRRFHDHATDGDFAVLDLRRFEVVTFDCYGTLIDWESGILSALASFRSDNHLDVTDDDLLEAYGALETVLESGDHVAYREVLRGVMRGLATRFSVPAGRFDPDALAESLPHWPPFPDTVAALRRLHARVKLGVISNIDDDLFAATAPALEVPFDWVITAAQVGAYKPSIRNFVHALEVIGVPKERVLHAAQSRYHDVAPARSLGIATVWVNRRHGKTGDGATAPSSATPDLEVPDLATLAGALEAGA
jgi:2-haloacid dehalogenase